jgi:hypothetical protein
MTKRCIKGVICVENITMVLCIILALLVFLFYKTGGANQIQPGSNIVVDNGAGTGAFLQSLHLPPFATAKPNTFFTNDEADVLTNPYAPPLKDNALLSGMKMGPSYGGGGGAGGIPINVATSAAVNTAYRQIGLLTKATPAGSGSDDPVIMPLMGRPLFTSRDKWLFYTISDKNNAMKLPIIIKGRNALSEIGVDNVYTGDTVYVQGYNDTFRVTLYENSAPQYIPFL